MRRRQALEGLRRTANRRKLAILRYVVEGRREAIDENHQIDQQIAWINDQLTARCHSTCDDATTEPLTAAERGQRALDNCDTLPQP